MIGFLGIAPPREHLELGLVCNCRPEHEHNEWRTMKFTSRVDVLLAAVNTASKAAGSRVEILGGVLLKTSGASLEVSATNMDVVIIVWNILVGNKRTVQKNGSAVVNSKTLFNTLKTFAKDDFVTLEGSAKDAVVTLTRGATSVLLPAFEIEDYPKLPDIVAVELATVPSVEFRSALERVRRSCSKDKSRPVLCSVNMKFANGTLCLESTDSYRLSRATVSVPVNSESKIMVSGRNLELLERILGKNDSFSIELSDHVHKWTRFGFGDTCLLVRANEGVFPDVDRLLPKEFVGYITFDRVKALSAISRMAKLSKGNAEMVRLDVGSKVIASLTSRDVVTVKETIEATSTFSTTSAYGFNPSFLEDGLSSLTEDTVTMALGSPLKPGLLYEGNPLKPGHLPDDFYLLMPIKLAS